jgi:hypothetical protein
MDMAKQSKQNHEVLTKMVRSSLRKAQEITSDLRKKNTRLLIAGMVFSAGTTLVAGGTAAAGPVVGVGVTGWKIACIVAAVLAFASTVSTALTTQLKFGERLSHGNQCIGRLKSLDVAIATGSENWEEVNKEYGEIVKAYTAFIG